MEKQKVLIVGGGFGGIKAALEISHNSHYDVTLLSDRPNFRYYPSLYHTATGGTQAQSNIPLTALFDKKSITVVIGSAKKLDRTKKHIVTSDGLALGYDILILSLGVMTNYFGIKGLEEYSYGIKSLEEAEQLKSHLHKQLIDEGKPDLNYIIVGGGPSGIELAGALPTYLRYIMQKHGIKHRAIHIDLIEAAPQLVPRLPTDMSFAIARRLQRLGVRLYLGQTVEGETADSLMVNNQKLPSHTVIWTAGVTNHPFFKDNQFKLTTKGKVVVNEHLQAEPNIYVLGDNADTPYSGMAQTALYDGVFVATQLKHLAHGYKMPAYKPKKPIYVTPAGPHWSAVYWGNIRLYGWLGWVLRETADWVGYHDFEPWWKASKEWFTEFETEVNCPVCAASTSK